MGRPNPSIADEGERNNGLSTRASLTACSAEVDMIWCIHSAVFFQWRYMFYEVNTKIKLARSKHAFCTMAAGDQAFKTKNVSACLFVLNVNIIPSVYLAHAKALERC